MGEIGSSGRKLLFTTTLLCYNSVHRLRCADYAQYCRCPVTAQNLKSYHIIALLVVPMGLNWRCRIYIAEAPPLLSPRFLGVPLALLLHFTEVQSKVPLQLFQSSVKLQMTNLQNQSISELIVEVAGTSRQHDSTSEDRECLRMRQQECETFVRSGWVDTLERY